MEARIWVSGAQIPILTAHLSDCRFAALIYMCLPNHPASRHLRRILVVSNCMVKLPHKLGIVGAERDVEEYRPVLRSRPHAAPSPLESSSGSPPVRDPSMR